MRQLESLILKVAQETRVPAGDSLAVDREVFSREVTHMIENLENVKVIRGEVASIPQEGITIIATGPLTSESLSNEIQRVTGSHRLFFYDAISPIVTADSINDQKIFKSSRYGKGGEDYINCPMSEAEYDQFVETLNQAERVPVQTFEKRYLFEGCLPIEEMAERGKSTLAHGPLKPVGLIDPKTGKQPFAVVQLRQEDRYETLFNLVGFQTRLKHEEQKRVFRMIPGLEHAEFARLGSIHRNTFIDSPRCLRNSLQLKHRPNLFFAGQITGVEGYMESTAMGLLCGISAYRFANGMPPSVPSSMTAIGALIHYITQSPSLPFQPMNINFGLFPPLPIKSKGRIKRLSLAKRALKEMGKWRKEVEG
jgi:methylenetetrahydrofolate--tRNA-(uracil-5-)-methyltransferase